MELSDLLIRNAVAVDMRPASKDEWIEQLVELLVRAWRLRRPEEILHAVLDREATLSTAVGDGVAIPHAKSDAVPRLVLACGVAPGGVEFEVNVDVALELLGLFACRAQLQQRMEAAVVDRVQRGGVPVDGGPHLGDPGDGVGHAGQRVAVESGVLRLA